MKKAAAPLDPAKMTAMLRAGALAIGPGDIGLTAADCPPVWGVLLELAEAEATVTLVALADGSVSIYLSNGDGVIGCGLHPDVRVAAAKLLQVANQATQLCTPVAEYPLPAQHMVRVYLLTNGGVLGAVASRAELDEGALALAEIYYAGYALISMVELLGAGVDLVDEMRLAATATQKDLVNSGEPVQEFKARGRRCRILPYVGNVARRSQH